MPLSLQEQFEALERMTAKELRAKYKELFGEATRSGNVRFLAKRIAWRMQELAEGGLSERAKRRAEELANDADLRVRPPNTARANDDGAGATPGTTTTTARIPGTWDDRLPPPGTVLVRKYKDETVRVTVLDHGFEYRGVVYRSLSALACAITGSHINGYRFFRLGVKRKPKEQDEA